MHVFFSTPCFEFMLCLLIILLLFLYWYIFCDLHACYFILLFCCITVIFSAVLAFYMIIRLALYLVLLGDSQIVGYLVSQVADDVYE